MPIMERIPNGHSFNILHMEGIAGELKRAGITLSFPLLWGNSGYRGWYDYPQSALRPRTVWPSAPATPDVCKSVCEWVVHNSARGRCVLCRRDLVPIL